MSDSHSMLAEPYADRQQQHHAAMLGMWTFLATEVLFFGALFVLYAVFRHFYLDAFGAASRRTNVLYGTINSVLLLTSSFSVAWAVRAAQLNHFTATLRGLLGTVLLGLTFLVVKGLEYHQDIQDHLVPGPQFASTLPLHAEVFFWLYWAMTGLHAVHVIVGLTVLSVITLWTWRRRNLPAHCTTIELAALYWHFVDSVWLYLYPLLYLVNRHS